MILIKKTGDHSLIAELNRDIQNLHAKLFPTIFKPHDQEAMLSAFEQMMAKENCHVYVAYLDKKPVGYIILFLQKREESAFVYSSTSIYVDQIFVDENYRGKGIGKKLLSFAKEKGMEWGADKIRLDHWTANKTAGKFFAANGYSYYNNRMEILLEDENI